MQPQRLAFLITALAGIVCLAVFFYKIIDTGERDFTILVIGFFMMALGISSFYRSRKQ